MSEYDWPEDYKHENGSYFCTCHDCNEQFIGHKRRRQCKACYMATLTTQLAEARAENERLRRACEYTAYYALDNVCEDVRNVAKAALEGKE